MDKFITTKALIPIRHNGTNYDAGAELELSQKDYENLLRIQAVEQTASANASKATSDNDKNGAGAGDNPPAPVAPETAEYAEKTNADQLAYLQTLGDEDFKAQAQDLLPVSKSKSKTYIERRLKDLTEVVE